jgi:hypothetical protein
MGNVITCSFYQILGCKIEECEKDVRYSKNGEREIHTAGK